MGGGFFGLPGSSLGQVSLLFLPLGVGQVALVIVMRSQSAFALIGNQVVLHKMRVLVAVDGLQGQLAQSFSRVQLLSEEEATILPKPWQHHPELSL